MPQPSIALFTPYLPAPAHSGGRIRIFRFAEALARIGDISLFATVGSDEAKEHGESDELAVYGALHLAESWLSFLPALRRPSRVRAASPPALARAFRKADAKHPFDVVVVAHSHSAWIPASGRAIPWILDEQNIESDYVEAKLRARHEHLSMMQRREVDALRRWESRLWQSATEVVCVSEEDAHRVKAVRGRAAVVVPNGVAADEVPFKLPSQRSGFDILFVGLMGHPPNVRAARWLALDILPLVLKKEPRARLVLCGAMPAREVLGLRSEHVDVTGRVPQVTPYLDQAAVYANALEQGAGTSLKVLEALASGIPLVSTRVGVRGFPLESPRHYLHAEDAKSFAERICECLREREARDEGAREGRTLAEQYSWDDIARRFATVVEGVAANGEKR